MILYNHFFWTTYNALSDFTYKQGLKNFKHCMYIWIVSLTLLGGQHVMGRQKVKGFKAVDVQFQGLFVARRG